MHLGIQSTQVLIQTFKCEFGRLLLGLGGGEE
jgi:hypothetical protein